jgi:secondary thiamine-phosphate synthase enzyme
MVRQHHLTFPTRGHGHLIDITEAIVRVVAQARIRTGTAHIFHVGSTAAVGAIEFEPGLQRDLPELLDRLIPPSADYAHELTWHDGNGHSHVQAALLGPSVAIAVRGGALCLGTWQQIVLINHDTRSRRRQVAVTVIGHAGTAVDRE